MAKSEIWYRRSYKENDEGFKKERDLIMGFEWARDHDSLPDADNLGATHVLLMEWEMSDPNKLFELFQGETWSPDGEARPIIRRLGLRHTSISVGDVIVIVADSGERKTLIVDNLGFVDIRTGQQYDE
ncbi:MAG: hypothetical protein ACLP29_00715 [Dissulfurispiraceae bacterium]